MSHWVDFKLLREKLDFIEVLGHYRIDFKRRGSQALCFCPLPTHQGNRNTPSFSISFEKRIFQCFGCGATGNILDFACRMEGLNPENPDQFRKAALIMQERFGPRSQPTAKPPSVSPPSATHSPLPQNRAPIRTAPQSNGKPPVLVNPPLDFQLKNLDTKPQYLANRGFMHETMKHFGLGYCSKGVFAGRVVIPLHDTPGRLIGYAGRLIFDEAIDEENPKYLFPGKRERNGQIHEFAKSLFVYNGHRIKPRVHDLVIVQGFPSVWWLWQAGFPDVVGLMGASCSVDQASIIVSLVARSGRIWILTDGTEPGMRCAHTLFEEIGSRRFCTWLRLSEGQPTDCSAEELQAMLEWKIEG